MPDLPSEQLVALMREAHVGVDHRADDRLDCCFTSYHRRAVIAAYRVGYAAGLGHDVSVNDDGDRVLVGDRSEP